MISKLDGKEYAVKIVAIENNNIGDILKEIKILKQCKNDYIVNYYGSYKNGNELWIVLEYCGAGSLNTIISTFLNHTRNCTLIF